MITRHLELNGDNYRTTYATLYICKQFVWQVFNTTAKQLVIELSDKAFKGSKKVLIKNWNQEEVHYHWEYKKLIGYYIFKYLLLDIDILSHNRKDFPIFVKIYEQQDT